MIETKCPSCNGRGKVPCLHLRDGRDGDECDCDGTSTCYRCGAAGTTPAWPRRLDLTPQESRRVARAGVAVGLALLRAEARKFDLWDAIRAHPCERVAAAPAMQRCPKQDGNVPSGWCAECRAVDPAWKAYRIAKGTARKAQSRLRALVLDLAWRR